MVCNIEGLALIQWGIAFVVGISTLLVNLMLKFVPDGICPKLGKDSVDDRRRGVDSQTADGDD